jgi:HSP20 family protein
MGQEEDIMLVRYRNRSPQLPNLFDVHREFDRLFDQVLRPRRVPVSAGPGFDLDETEEHYVLTGAVPGFTHEDLQLEVTPEGITVTGERKLDTPEGYEPLRKERSSLAFRRSYAFDRKLDPDQASATLKNGVLKIELAKRAEERPRTIAIRAA